MKEEEEEEEEVEEEDEEVRNKLRWNLTDCCGIPEQSIHR